MIVTPDRVIYAGLLGEPSPRTLGSLTLYVAPEAPFAIRTDGGEWQRAYFAVVPPNQQHEIRSEGRYIWLMLVEPESVNVAEALRTLPRLVPSRTADYLRLQTAFQSWLEDVDAVGTSTRSIDEHFLGRALEAHMLDPRLRRVVDSIRMHPYERFLAADSANDVGLSFSRFVHLFKEQIGMSFRAFCAWKRARALLPHVSTRGNLTDLALRIGYPDSTHFSHSIRRIYGLRPRDILTGSRELTVLENTMA